MAKRVRTEDRDRYDSEEEESDDYEMDADKELEHAEDIGKGKAMIKEGTTG